MRAPCSLQAVHETYSSPTPAIADENTAGVEAHSIAKAAKTPVLVEAVRPVIRLRLRLHQFGLRIGAIKPCHGPQDPRSVLNRARNNANSVTIQPAT